jgi:hypothetical protein
VDVFQRQIDALQALNAAHAKLIVAVRAENAAYQRARSVATLLRRALGVKYGKDVGAFADFGWRPFRKTGPKTTAGKLAGARKRAARRT